MKSRTVLIGLDGGTFTLLDPLMAGGVMPCLRELAAAGVRAELCSVIPALTPPAWTSLATGRSPGRHGIFDFFTKDAPAERHIRVADSRDVGAATIWSIADRNGLRTTVLNFPMTFPPPHIRGFVVPGWMPWRQLRLGCHPPELYDRLRGIPDLDVRKLAMDMATEAKAIEGCRPEEYEQWVELHLDRERQWHRIVRHLMREDPCELTAVLFEGPDKIQHLCWRFLDPAIAQSANGNWAGRVRRLCLEYYRELDRLIGDIAAAAGPEANVILASDHGFGAQTGTFFVNAWLERQGYLAWSNGAAQRAGDATELGLGQLARHTYQLDWSRTRAYVATPSSNGIHIVPGDDYERLREQLAADLAAATDPTTGERIVARIWRREQIFAGPYLELAPDLTLELTDGGLVSILASDTPFQRRAEIHGTHRPEGIFIAHGPALRRGAVVDPLSILDVAPLILHSLGLEVPADMEGRVPTEALDPTWLDQRGVRHGPAESGHPDATVRVDEAGNVPRRREISSVYTEEDERILAERLRALGYIN